MGLSRKKDKENKLEEVEEIDENLKLGASLIACSALGKMATHKHDYISLSSVLKGGRRPEKSLQHKACRSGGDHSQGSR